MSSEKNGKTLHLLKQGSKRIITDRKRKKVQLMGSFTEYKDSKKKPVANPADPIANAAPPLNFGSQGPPSIPPMFLQQAAPNQAKKDAEMKKTK